MSTYRGYCVARYCAMNGMVKEYKKYDKKPDTYFKNITVTHPQTGRTANLDIGYEQFLGPEMFFNPEIFHHKYTKGIPQLVDEAILSCPIDTRRAMYKVRWVVVPLLRRCNAYQPARLCARTEHRAVRRKHVVQEASHAFAKVDRCPRAGTICRERCAPWRPRHGTVCHRRTMNRFAVAHRGWRLLTPERTREPA